VSPTEIVIGLVIAIGVVGTIIPVLPGSLLTGAAILVWATELGTTRGWVVLGIALVCILIGSLSKYLLPGRNLKKSGVPNSSLLIGGIVAIVGFFVIPVVGLLIGFVAGIYLAERRRLGSHDQAWPSTKDAIKAVGLGILIEFLAAFSAALVWGIAVVTG